RARAGLVRARARNQAGAATRVPTATDRPQRRRALACAGMSAVQPNDLVLVHTHGRSFYARVIGAERFGRYAISPLDAGIRVRSVQLAELRAHWSHQGDPRPAAAQADQASFDHLLDR